MPKELVKSEIQVVDAFQYDAKAAEKTAEQVIKHRNGNMAEAQAITIVENPQNSALANQVVKRLTTIWDAFEYCRKRQTTPALEFKKMCDAFWNMLKQPVQAEIDRIDGLIRTYRRELEAKEAAEVARIAAEEARRRRIQEAHAAQGHQVSAPIVLERPKVSELKLDAAKTRKYWTFDRVNIDLTKLSLEYMQPNLVAINQAVQGGKREIPGVNIYQEESIIKR